MSNLKNQKSNSTQTNEFNDLVIPIFQAIVMIIAFWVICADGGILQQKHEANRQGTNASQVKHIDNYQSGMYNANITRYKNKK